jgi:hypothetical protein
MPLAAAAPALATVLANSNSNRDNVLTPCQLQPRVGSMQSKMRPPLSEAQLHKTPPAKNAPGAVESGQGCLEMTALERGISLRDGIVFGALEAEEHAHEHDRKPTMQMPLMLDRFIYDT